MTTDEKYNELGRLVAERRELKLSLACAQSKLDRYRKILQQADAAIQGLAAWSFDETTFVVQPVPGMYGGGVKDAAYPTPQALGQALSDKLACEKRIQEIDERLNAAGC